MSSAKVSVNRNTCEGYANCIRAAPGVFDLDDSDVVTLKREDLSEEDLPRVRRAAYDCPTNSIAVVDDAPGSA
jgi:ferredoxin